jgi:hypothetical protein
MMEFLLPGPDESRAKFRGAEEALAN